LSTRKDIVDAAKEFIYKKKKERRRRSPLLLLLSKHWWGYIKCAWRGPERRSLRDFLFLFLTLFKNYFYFSHRFFYFIPNIFLPLPTQGSGISTLPLFTWRSGKVADVTVGTTRAWGCRSPWRSGKAAAPQIKEGKR
jgi:hypothetical protein